MTHFDIKSEQNLTNIIIYIKNSMMPCYNMGYTHHCYRYPYLPLPFQQLFQLSKNLETDSRRTPLNSYMLTMTGNPRHRSSVSVVLF